MRIAPRLVPIAAARRITARAQVGDRATFDREPPPPQPGADPVIVPPAPAMPQAAFAAQQLGQEWQPAAPEIDPAHAAHAYRQRARPPFRTPRLRAVA